MFSLPAGSITTDSYAKYVESRSILGAPSNAILVVSLHANGSHAANGSQDGRGPSLTYSAIQSIDVLAYDAATLRNASPPCKPAYVADVYLIATSTPLDAIDVFKC